MTYAEVRAAVSFGAVVRVGFTAWTGGGWGARVETSAVVRADDWVVTERGTLRRWRTLDAAVAFFVRAGYDAQLFLLPSAEQATAYRTQA